MIDAPDLTDPGFVDDPYPWFAAARAKLPMVWHDATGQWLAVTFEAANAVLPAVSRKW